jgi:hypothetical protein
MSNDGKARRTSRSKQSAASERFHKLEESSRTWSRKVERTVEKARRAGRRRSSAT